MRRASTRRGRRRPPWPRRADDSRLEELLGDEAEDLLQHERATFAASQLHLPGPDFVDRVCLDTDRSPTSCATCSGCSTRGRLAGTGYVLDPPGRPGHRALRGRELRAQPHVLRPREPRPARHRGRLQRVRLDVRRPRRDQPQVGAQVPLHRQAQPQRAADVPQRVRPGHVRRVQRAWDIGAAGVGATIYFGSDQSRPPDRRGRARPSRRPTGSACSPCCGATCATPAFVMDGTDYHLSADLTGQANHLGVTIQADIIKQKLPENNGGYNGAQPERRVVRQDQQAGLHEAHDRQPDRPHPLPGRSTATLGRIPLINSRRRVVGRERPGRGRAHGRHQQARGRHGPDLGPQGVPAPDGRGHRAAERDPGRLPLARGHDRLVVAVQRARACASRAP